MLRRFLLAAAIVGAIGALVIGWITSAFLFSPCQYTLMQATVSPSERYVAEVYSASCGMSESRSILMLRDRSALTLTQLDEVPPGTIVADDVKLDAAGEDLFWEGETRLVLQYAGPNAPNLVEAEWGGVRIETRRSAP